MISGSDFYIFGDESVPIYSWFRQAWRVTKLNSAICCRKCKNNTNLGQKKPIKFDEPLAVFFNAVCLYLVSWVCLIRNYYVLIKCFEKQCPIQRILIYLQNLGCSSGAQEKPWQGSSQLMKIRTLCYVTTQQRLKCIVLNFKFSIHFKRVSDYYQILLLVIFFETTTTKYYSARVVLLNIYYTWSKTRKVWRNIPYKPVIVIPNNS